MGWLRSVAMIAMDSGSDSAMARVTTPVPAATSSTDPIGLAATRFARSAAYGSNMSGTKHVS
jgi:hypothetical protein